VGAFSVGWHELGRFPFRIARDEFDPGQGGGALGEAADVRAGVGHVVAVSWQTRLLDWG
jgi:hypothetical protein